MEPYWDVVRRIIEESDLVLEVVDARLVGLSRNEEVEKLIEEIGRPVIYVINKSDLVSSKSLKKQVANLKKKGDVVFISTKTKGSTKVLLYAIKKAFSKGGKRPVKERLVGDPKPEYREARGDIVVGVLGYPNVGKSSIINVLSHKKKVKVSKKAGTTHGIHWVRANKEIKLIDSPGVIPLQVEDELRYALIGARNPEKLKDAEKVAGALIKLFGKNNPKSFEKLYGVEIKGEIEKVLEEISKKKGHLLKKGKLDVNRTAMVIVRDWQNGKLRL